jgi:hypothetical protein
LFMNKVSVALRDKVGFKKRFADSICFVTHFGSPKRKTPNARHQRRARTGVSDKPRMRDMLIARPLHAIVELNPPAGG